MPDISGYIGERVKWDPCFITVEDLAWFVKCVILLEALFKHVEIFVYDLGICCHCSSQ